ncbi:MAG: 30S ribosomal protein S7 [Chloroflexi bacterium]|nr:30S ribosomal protein S7 [Chloroflexota bacterium]
MARRRRAVRRSVTPDPRYKSEDVSRFVNRMMQRGKRHLSTGIFYRALDTIGKEQSKDPLPIFESALRNTTPLLQVKPRRVGGATYQVPLEVRPELGSALAARWLIKAAQARKGMPMYQKLAAELSEASRGQGAAVRRREEMHRMAEANRAFAHYRW